MSRASPSVLTARRATAVRACSHRNTYSRIGLLSVKIDQSLHIAMVFAFDVTFLSHGIAIGPSDP